MLNKFKKVVKATSKAQRMFESSDNKSFKSMEEEISKNEVIDLGKYSKIQPIELLTPLEKFESQGSWLLKNESKNREVIKRLKERFPVLGTSKRLPPEEGEDVGEEPQFYLGGEKVNEKAVKSYLKFKDAFKQAKASTKLEDRREFVVTHVPTFFAELQEAKILVDRALVLEILAMFVAYVKLDKGWSFTVVEGDEKYKYEIESIYENKLDGVHLAKTTIDVAPIPGGSSWRISRTNELMGFLILLTGTSSDGAHRDVLNFDNVAAGAFADADREIGIAIIEDEPTREWVTSCIKTHRKVKMLVAGHSLGAGSGQILCRTALQEEWHDDVCGYFFSPPSPSEPPTTEWKKLKNNFHYIANGSDPVVNFGGVYSYPGLEFVLRSRNTPNISGSQDVLIDQLIAHHGTPNLLFARLSGMDTEFTERKSTKIDPDFKMLFWTLNDNVRQSMMHIMFKPTTAEIVMARTENTKWRDLFFGNKSGARGKRLAALVSFVKVLKKKCTTLMSVEAYVDLILPHFDKLMTNDDEEEKTRDAIYRDAAWLVLATRDYEPENFNSAFQEATSTLDGVELKTVLGLARLAAQKYYSEEEYYSIKKPSPFQLEE